MICDVTSGRAYPSIPAMCRRLLCGLSHQSGLSHNLPCLRPVLFPRWSDSPAEFTGSDSDKRLCLLPAARGLPSLPAPAEVLLINLSEKSTSPCPAQQRQSLRMEPIGGWMSSPGQELDSTLPSILSGHKAAATSVTLPVPDFCAK